MRLWFFSSLTLKLCPGIHWAPKVPVWVQACPRHTCLPSQSISVQGRKPDKGSQQHPLFFSFQTELLDLSDLLNYYSLLSLLFFLECRKHLKFCLNHRCHRNIDSSSAGKFLFIPKQLSLLRERLQDYSPYTRLPSFCLTEFSHCRGDFLVVKNSLSLLETDEPPHTLVAPDWYPIASLIGRIV